MVSRCILTEEKAKKPRRAFDDVDIGRTKYHEVKERSRIRYLSKKYARYRTKRSETRNNAFIGDFRLHCLIDKAWALLRTMPVFTGAEVVDNVFTEDAY